MIYGLPTKLEVGGKEYEIRSDFRAILDIFTALNDPELSQVEKTQVMLEIFYVDADEFQYKDIKEAIEKCNWFIQMGEEEDKKTPKPKLMDWEQDFFPLISAINRVAGQEVRSLDYLHWWTFLGYYNEIGGDCYFAQIVQVRDKMRRGKMDKADKEFYRLNRDRIEFKQKYTEAEESVLDRWIGNGGESNN